MGAVSSLWWEFGQIALAHALAVASPGPDFAMVLRQSLAHGRKTGLWTSVGIGSGILVHVTYSLVGVGLLLKSSILAFTLFKFVGAGYLAWIGWQALRSAGHRNPDLPPGAVPNSGGPSAIQAWRRGFLTNALNPKATLFFVALFPTVVSATTPKSVQIGYGLWMAGATAVWFSFVSLVFTHEKARRVFVQGSHWIDRLLGLVFLGFAVSLVLTSVV
jgi:RhtB (resistance to homoserine/threonine) family protein